MQQVLIAEAGFFLRRVLKRFEKRVQDWQRQGLEVDTISVNGFGPFGFRIVALAVLERKEKKAVGFGQ